MMMMLKLLIPLVTLLVVAQTSNEAHAQELDSVLGRLSSQASRTCVQAENLDVRSRQAQFRANASRRQFARFCTAGRRQGNEARCSRFQRQARREDSNARRLSRNARGYRRECVQVRRKIEREKRR